jgi:hypothetical protein
MNNHLQTTIDSNNDERSLSLLFPAVTPAECNIYSNNPLHIIDKQIVNSDSINTDLQSKLLLESNNNNFKQKSDLLWTNKYKPNNSSDLIINQDKINQIKHWLNNLKNNNKQTRTIIITGNHGIGKNLTINIILKELNYTINTLSSNNIKNKKTIDEIINTCCQSQYIHNTKYALIIDDTDSITLTSEKDSLLELCKYNDKHKIMPIIFISNNQHSKLISDIKKNATEYKFSNPTNEELLTIFNKITKNEKMNIIDIKVINTIIKYAQHDIRNLIFILHDIFVTYGRNEVNLKRFQQYITYSKKKDIDIGLYDASKLILDNYKSINYCMELYETEKVLLPLMIYENYYKSMYAKIPSNNNKDILLQHLDISRSVCDSISQGDVIETNIYTDQNWMNQSIHGFYTICNSSYIINKNKSNNLENNKYKIDFSADLNKTSLKNINRKNITNLQSIIPNKKVDDLLYINKIIYDLISNNMIKEAYQICKDYNIDSKILEIIIKIDKNNDKLIITPKMKKLFC